MRQGVLKVFGDANKISNFERIKQNIIPLDVVKLDDKNLEKIRKSIEKNKIK